VTTLPPLIEGHLITRRNRFVAEVDVVGATHVAHVPNTGRMRELFVAGARVLLRPAPPDSGRRTAYDLLLIEYRGRWVGVDSRMPPHLVVDAWRAGLLDAFSAYESVRREVCYGESRLDLLFDGPPGLLYVEAKSVNLVENGTAWFPDAPTTRGARHLRELQAAVHEGYRAAVVFVVQRDDVERLMPYDEADPAFAEALRVAIAHGVEAYAIACAVGQEGATPVGLVPVVVTREAMA
jgi:sugar fermentation stimulation protein A